MANHADLWNRESPSTLLPTHVPPPSPLYKPLLSLSQTCVRSTLHLFWQGSGFMSSRNYSRAFWGFLELTLKLKNAGVNYRTAFTNYRHTFAPMSVRVYTMDSSAKGIPIRALVLFWVFSHHASSLDGVYLFLENFHGNVKFSTNLFFFFFFFGFDLTIEGSRTWNMTIQVIFGHLKSAIHKGQFPSTRLFSPC